MGFCWVTVRNGKQPSRHRPGYGSGPWGQIAGSFGVSLFPGWFRLRLRGRGEDDARVRAYLDKAAEGLPGTLLVTLMPTLQCNLACNYCFQKDHPAFTKMTRPTEDATLEWILRVVDERGLRKISVHYFGG